MAAEFSNSIKLSLAVFARYDLTFTYCQFIILAKIFTRINQVKAGKRSKSQIISETCDCIFINLTQVWLLATLAKQKRRIILLGPSASNLTFIEPLINLISSRPTNT